MASWGLLVVCTDVYYLPGQCYYFLDWHWRTTKPDIVSYAVANADNTKKLIIERLSVHTQDKQSSKSM